MKSSSLLLLLSFICVTEVYAWTPACNQALTDLRPICDTLPNQSAGATVPTELAILDRDLMYQIIWERGELSAASLAAGVTSRIQDSSTAQVNVLRAQRNLIQSYLTACEAAIRRCNSGCAREVIAPGVTPPTTVCADWEQNSLPRKRAAIRIVDANIQQTLATVGASAGGAPSVPSSQSQQDAEYGYSAEDNGSPGLTGQ